MNELKGEQDKQIDTTEVMYTKVTGAEESRTNELSKVQIIEEGESTEDIEKTNVTNYIHIEADISTN